MANLDENPRFKLGTRDTMRILWPYVRHNFMDQVNGIWFIVAYLIIFQLLILQLPIVYALPDHLSSLAILVRLP